MLGSHALLFVALLLLGWFDIYGYIRFVAFLAPTRLGVLGGIVMGVGLRTKFKNSVPSARAGLPPRLQLFGLDQRPYEFIPEQQDAGLGLVFYPGAAIDAAA